VRRVRKSAGGFRPWRTTSIRAGGSREMQAASGWLASTCQHDLGLAWARNDNRPTTVERTAPLTRSGGPPRLANRVSARIDEAEATLARLAREKFAAAPAWVEPPRVARHSGDIGDAERQRPRRRADLHC